MTLKCYPGMKIEWTAPDAVNYNLVFSDGVESGPFRRYHRTFMRPGIITFYETSDPTIIGTILVLIRESDS